MLRMASAGTSSSSSSSMVSARECPAVGGQASALALLNLPLELLCDIFSFLKHIDLLHIQATCKTLRKVIDESSRLQFIVDLSFFRMISTRSLDREPSAACRRRILLDRENSWRRLKYSEKYTLQIPNKGSVYEFAAGIYANAPADMWSISTSDYAMVDFTFSAAQDLLVIVAHGRVDATFDLHLRTLSNNEPHPSAAASILTTPESIYTVIPEAAVTLKVEVVGDLLVLLCREVFLTGHEWEFAGSVMQFWTWRMQQENSCVLEIEDGVDDFCFIGKKTLLVITKHGVINAYCLEDVPREPVCTGKYSLPRLHERYMYSFCSMSCHPTPGMDAGPSGSSLTEPSDLFYPNPEKQLMLFFVTIWDQDNLNGSFSYVFVATIDTFCRPPEAYLKFARNPRHRISHSTVPWSLWGIANTHWFPERDTAEWQHAHFGYKTIETINPDSDPLAQAPRKLRMRDFNPNIAKRSKKSAGAFSLWEDRIVHGSPSGMEWPGNNPFTERVGCCMSYREVVSEEKFDVTDAMMDGTRILLVKRDKTGEMTRVDVLVM